MTSSPSVTTVQRAIIDASDGPERAPEGGLATSRFAVPLGNVPLISHVLAELATRSITQAVVLAGPGCGRALRQTLQATLGTAPDVSVVEAGASEPHHAVLALLAAALDDGPVLLHPGDALYGHGLAAALGRAADGDVDAVLPAETAVIHGGRPARVSESPVVLGPGARDLVETLAGPDVDDGPLVPSLLAGDLRLAVCEMEARWTYDDATEALLAGNRLVLDELVQRRAEPSIEQANELRGRIAIGHGTFISGCEIHGPVAIDDHAVIEDSFIGPYTAIGAGAVLSGAEIDDAMVLPRAEIRHPGQRIVGSIIGEDARVSRTFGMPRGLRLRVGPGSRVSLG